MAESDGDEYIDDEFDATSRKKSDRYQREIPEETSSMQYSADKE